MRSRMGSIGAAFSLSALPALACSCSGDSGSCQAPAADIIIRATVVSKEIIQASQPFVRPAPSGAPERASRPAGAIPQREPWGRVKVTLAISERFHGEAGGSLVVRTELGTEACGYPFEVGHEYLVFANEYQGNTTVTTCSATQPAKMAIARIEQLRALRDGSALPDLYGFVGTYPLRWDPTGWEHVQPMPRLTVVAKSDNAVYRTETGDDGLYGFRGLPAGRYQLSVEAPPGRRALWGGRAEHAGASPGVLCPMNFEVFWDGLISGTVVRRDGHPVSGMITAQYTGLETLPAGPYGGQVTDGRFEILRLPPGRYRLMFLPIEEGRPAGSAVYYPGTQTQSAAALIDVGDGAHVSGLQFSVF